MTDLQTRPVDESQPLRSKIGLCLSGGGFRATYFHLGLIRFLRDTKLLDQVTTITAVSGGSILAGHLVLNWPRYTGNDEEFHNAEAELLRFGLRNIRGRIIRRWVLAIIFPFLRFLPTYSRRTPLLAREYAKLLKNALLRDIAKLDRPILHLLSTSFITGNLCSFSNEGFSVDDGKSLKLHRTAVLPLSFAVAASSAFPPVFPPAILTRAMLGAAVADLPYDPELLTDGGVFDNLGYAKIARLFATKACDLDTVIISDAGARFDWDIKGRFSRVISRTVRSTDILMKRVSDLTLTDASAKYINAEIFQISISDVVHSPTDATALPIDLQKKLSIVRTDLDRFTQLEMGILACHGYEISALRLAALVDPALQHISRNTAVKRMNASLAFVNNDISLAARLLERASLREIGLLDFRDWVSFALASYVLAISFLIALPYLYVAQRAKEVSMIESRLLSKRTVRVSYATDRKPELGISGIVNYSSTLFDEELHTGTAQVIVPIDHILNHVETPSAWSFNRDPLRYFVLANISVDSDLAAPPVRESREGALIYIHGFNTTFDLAMMETAQLSWDVQYRGIPIGYSWTSKGSVTDYFFDREAALFSTAHFIEYVSMLVNPNDDKKIDIVAKSVGAAVLVNATTGLSAAMPGRHPFGQIIFINPDVDEFAFVSSTSVLSKMADRGAGRAPGGPVSLTGGSPRVAPHVTQAAAGAGRATSRGRRRPRAARDRRTARRRLTPRGDRPRETTR